MVPSIKHDGSIKGGSRGAKGQNNDHNPDVDEFTCSTDCDSSAAEDSYLSHYDSPECALLAYARTNKLDKLRSLIQARRARQINLDLNFKGRQKQNFSWSALHLASYFGNVNIAKELLKYFSTEIDVNIQNNLGDTPLHKATLTQREDMVQLLLEYNADIFIRNSDGLTAKQLTQHNRIVDLIDAAECADYNRRKLTLLDAIVNNDLEYVKKCISIYDCATQHVGPATTTGPVLADANTPSNFNSIGNQQQQLPNANLDIRFITDDRGNTPLHLAALRGHKAMCVLLLEKGLVPHVKNHRGQTAIDVATFQIRQLLMNVKPSDTQISRITKQHSVRRFEGQLMKKVRFLGWKPIYAVLENGVFLIFNNRNDSMNKSRRGYKYLESATCEPDPVNVGVFSIFFSDRSRVLLMIPSNSITASSPYLANDTDQYSKSVIITSTSTTNTSQSPNRNIKLVELARQKWTDAINDHIRYSTEFIKKGLRLNEDDDDDYYDNGAVGGLSNLNQLLPVDTITSIFQEARAHQSILERHATSLTSLIESIPSISAIVLQEKTNGSVSDKHNQKALDSSYRRNSSASQQSQERPLSGGIFSRMASSYRSGRSQTIAENPADSHKNLAANASDSSGLTEGSPIESSMPAASEFLQETWPSVLFHLKLLIESSQHTKATLSQALGLMEHQEHMRQQRIQDQEERCRVLEDSLHMLARDHHELEKSISTTSLLYNTAMARTVSISTVNTDLNEYFDAFEDFDDEKTVTPSSMPSDDELDFDDMPHNFLGNKNKQKCNIKTLNEAVMRERSPANNSKLVSDDPQIAKANAGLEDDEDTRSDCSALTVENNNEASELGVVDVDGVITNQSLKNRTQLPCPMVNRDQISIWNILKNCIGKDLSRITMPVVFNEPLTMLQRACESIQFSRYIQLADQSDDPIERMEYICAFIIAGLSANCERIIKPFNPLLYETYEIEHELDGETKVRAVAQQVSHHPPVSAAYSESDYFVYCGSINPKIKFWGRSVDVQPDGQCSIILKRHNEKYTFKSVSCTVHNIIVGKLWFEHHGPLEVINHTNDVRAQFDFKRAGWFGKDLHRFDGFISTSSKSNNKTKINETNNSKGRRVRFIYGKWSDYIKTVDIADYERYMQENPNKLFRIPDKPNEEMSLMSTTNLLSKFKSTSIGATPTINSNQQSSQQDYSSNSDNYSSTESETGLPKGESMESLDIPNSKILWRRSSDYHRDYYNFTHFTMILNELSDNIASKLPRSDSRFRPDVRSFEEGDLDQAANEKHRLEEKQREARKKVKKNTEPHEELLWFKTVVDPDTKEKVWSYKGGYWESKKDPSKFANIF